MKLSRGLRVTLVAALVGSGAAVLPTTTAQAAVVNATLVRTVWTGGPNSTWSHPSPDPSGITYNSGTGQLIISDGEVEENDPTKYPNNVWMGTNLFVANLQGELLETGANTLAYSKEPTGVGFRPSLSATFPERLFISDDDQARVFEVDRGSDGRYGTSDDSQTSFSVAFLNLGPRADAEDLAVDLELTRNSQLLLVDGKGKRVFVYSPGPNNVFDGQAAEGGDDVVERVINVGALGAGDPEGIAYNPSRNTVFVLDDPSNQIYEINLQGNLQNIIKLPFTMKSGAGLALAPPSNGSGGAPNAYIVDRGVDNDTNQSTFNDGRLYEIAIPGLTGGGGPTPNAAPTVSAGPDRSVVLPNTASLDGSATDDGKPNGTLTTTWSMSSGPGTVTFGNAAAQDTTATFSAAGTYVLRLTASDGELSTSDEVSVVVSNSTPSGTVLDVPVRVGSDDAEERPSGSVLLGSGDLNLGQDASTPQTVGMRFTGVTVPEGATITNAYVKFVADEVRTASTSLVVAAQASDNPATFTTASKSISTRPRTTATVSWNPPDWPTVGAAHQSPDIRSVLQEIVNRADWASGDPLVLIVTGSGDRTAESFEGGAAKAPVLHIEFAP